MASTYPHTHALLAAWNAQINTVSWEVRLEWVTAYLSRREIWPSSIQFPSLHERQARSQKCLSCPLNFSRKNITTWSFYLFQTVAAVFVQQACHSLSHGQASRRKDGWPFFFGGAKTTASIQFYFLTEEGFWLRGETFSKVTSLISKYYNDLDNGERYTNTVIDGYYGFRFKRFSCLFLFSNKTNKEIHL